MSTEARPVLPPALAVVADALVQQQRLRALLTAAGYRVLICTSPQNLAHHQDHRADIDLWIVDGDLDRCPEPQRDWLLDSTTNRLLFDEGPNCSRDDPAYETWSRRLLASIHRHLGATLRQALAVAKQASPPESPEALAAARYQAPQKPPIPMPPELAAYTSSAQAAETIPELWILVASLGGPMAVKQFLDALPAHLPCTFIYAQHIDVAFEAQLARTIGRHSAVSLHCLTHNDRLLAGHAYIAPVGQNLHFDAHGRVQMTDQPWRGPYSPCLDELMETAATQYPEIAHGMVFSGMAGDALDGSASIRNQGGEVWVQSRDSCIQPAMPRLMEEAGFATGGGDPRSLALQLIGFLTARYTPNHGTTRATPTLQRG